MTSHAIQFVKWRGTNVHALSVFNTRYIETIVMLDKGLIHGLYTLMRLPGESDVWKIGHPDVIQDKSEDELEFSRGF